VGNDLTNHKILEGNYAICEYCDGEAQLEEIIPFEEAVCPECGSKHAWDHQDAMWFGL